MRKVWGRSVGVYDTRLDRPRADALELCQRLETHLGVLTMDLACEYLELASPHPDTVRSVVDTVMNCAVRLSQISPNPQDAQIYIDQMARLCRNATESSMRSPVV